MVKIKGDSAYINGEKTHYTKWGYRTNVRKVKEGCSHPRPILTSQASSPYIPQRWFSNVQVGFLTSMSDG